MRRVSTSSLWVMLSGIWLGCADEGAVATADLAAGTPACALGDEVATASACTDDTVPLTAGPSPSGAEPRIEAGQSYGLRLVADGAANVGAVWFAAPADGEYVVYLGTPTVPLSVGWEGGPVDLTCTVCMGGSACPLMRRAFGMTLVKGRDYRIALGPIAPQRWVRFRIERRQPAPSRDAIVVAAALDGQASTDLYAVSPDGGVRRILGGSGDETLPRWSPDGSRLAYVLARALRVASATGADDHLVASQVGRGLAAPGSTVTAAAWSPDGQRLVYPFPRDPYVVGDPPDRVDESYETTLHFVGVDGTGDVAYAEPFVHRSPPGMGTLYEPAWSSRGVLMYSSDDDCPDCAGGGETASSLADGSGYRHVQVNAGAGDVHHLDFSPDGLAVVFERDASGRPPTITRAEIVTPVDPTRLVLATHDLGVVGRNPVWSPDGRSIAYVGADGIYVIDAQVPAPTPRRVLAVTGVRGIDW